MVAARANEATPGRLQVRSQRDGRPPRPQLAVVLRLESQDAVIRDARGAVPGQAGPKHSQ